MPRRAGAYAQFVGAKMREGHSMAEAARMWKGGHHHGHHEGRNPDILGFNLGRYQRPLLYGGIALLVLGAAAPSVAAQIPVIGPTAVSLTAPLAGLFSGLMPTAAAPAAAASPAQVAAAPSSNLPTSTRPMGI